MVGSRTGSTAVGSMEVPVISIPRHSATDPLADMVSALVTLAVSSWPVSLINRHGARWSPNSLRIWRPPVKPTTIRLRSIPGELNADGARGRSGQVRELILHPTVTAICDHFLRPNARWVSAP
jgi:hypothetical protein